jgi:hypothetical protein
MRASARGVVPAGGEGAGTAAIVRIDNNDPLFGRRVLRRHRPAFVEGRTARGRHDHKKEYPATAASRKSTWLGSRAPVSLATVPLRLFRSVDPACQQEVEPAPRGKRTARIVRLPRSRPTRHVRIGNERPLSLSTAQHLRDGPTAEQGRERRVPSKGRLTHIEGGRLHRWAPSGSLSHPVACFT